MDNLEPNAVNAEVSATSPSQETAGVSQEGQPVENAAPPASIPYSRFSEVYGKMKTYESENERIKQEYEEAARKAQSYDELMNLGQNMNQGWQNNPQNPYYTPPDPVQTLEQKLASLENQMLMNDFDKNLSFVAQKHSLNEEQTHAFKQFAFKSEITDPEKAFKAFDYDNAYTRGLNEALKAKIEPQKAGEIPPSKATTQASIPTAVPRTDAERREYALKILESLDKK